MNVYGWSEKNLRPVLLELKKMLKSEGVNGRFANQNFQNLSVAQYKGLKGPEILITKAGDKFYLAKVVATQDIDAYSQRDYHKPYRDMQVGMLPPKLAQVMINLTGVQGRIWDPFCGGGALVMEGLLMGHDMTGSDIAKKNLEGARKNVDWLMREFQFSNSVELFVHDATQVLEGKQFDAIACEGYLGPPQSHPLTPDRLEPILNQLHELYTGFFRALKEMNFAGPVVIAMPFFRMVDKKEAFVENTVQDIKNLGFKLKIDPLTYARKDQIVGRAIYKFQLAP